MFAWRVREHSVYIFVLYILGLSHCQSQYKYKTRSNFSCVIFKRILYYLSLSPSFRPIRSKLFVNWAGPIYRKTLYSVKKIRPILSGTALYRRTKRSDVGKGQRIFRASRKLFFFFHLTLHHFWKARLFFLNVTKALGKSVTHYRTPPPTDQIRAVAKHNPFC